VKKSIVAGLVVLALIVLVSPGIVGHLAERSVDSQVEWAADENRELEITATGFERGWFRSAGRHRVEFAATPAGRELRELFGFDEGGAGPALIIETELDHGLLPVTSMGREQGSLMPGLGRAASRLYHEAPDGSVTALPGIVYTNIGLSGAVASRYAADAGSAGNIEWGAANVHVDSNARTHRLRIDGGLASFEFRSGDDRLSAGELRFVGDLIETPYDFYVGSVDVSLASVSRGVNGEELNFGPMKLTSDSTLEEGQVDNDFSIEMLIPDLPALGSVGWQMRGSLVGLDAAALGRVVEDMEAVRDEPDPALVFDAIESDLQDLLASGFSADIEQLDVSLPEGTVAATLAIDIGETESDPFVWTGLMLSTELRANVQIPKPLFGHIVSLNPDANSLLALGFLVSRGDFYELAAEYKQGLLTVNGAPMPIPFPSM
jgi:uncharacterized protein YdgA (DUF945 family)